MACLSGRLCVIEQRVNALRNVELIDHPQPCPIALSAGDLGGHAAVGKARRGEGQVAADEGRALLAERELSACGHRFGKERPDRLPALQQPPVVGVEDGLRLIKGHRAFDVSRPLPGNQQPLRILRIGRGLPARYIRHDGTPDATQSNRETTKLGLTLATEF